MMAIANTVRLIRSRKRRSTFALRLILFSTGLIVLSVGVSSVIVFHLKKKSLERSLASELLAIVNSTAPSIEGDLHRQIFRDANGELQGADEFELIRSHLLKVKGNNRLGGPGSPIYTMRKADDFDSTHELEFVVMTDHDKSGKFFVGNRYKPKPHNLAALAGTPATTGVYSDSEGIWISAAAPIYDGAKHVVGILQVDRPVDFFNQEVRKQAVPLLLGALVTALLATILAVIFARRLVNPIEELVQATSRIAHGDLNHRVTVRRRDELGELADSFNDMAGRLKLSLASIEAQNKALVESQQRTEKANLDLQTEINERVRAEEQIREQAALLDKAQDAILVRDLKNHIQFWNKSAESLYGWSKAEALNRDAHQLLYKPEQVAQAAKSWEEVLRKGDWAGELQQITRSGKPLVVHSRWSLVRDSGGEPKSVLVINTDITERKKLEVQLLRSQRMESIGTLAGGIAHDLNNALTPILISVGMLRTEASDPAMQRMLSTVENSAERAAGMVKQVLTFARGVEGERVPVQPKHLIREMEKIAEETFLKQVKIATDIPKDLQTIVGDATQLHQILLNLCVNARDAMPNGGTLTMSARNVVLDQNYSRLHLDAKPGTYVMISVSDTGTGIPAEVRDKIFEPFFTTKELGKGTGLGLSTVLAIVKSHGGFVNLYTEVGKGTKFEIFFPAHEATEVQTVERPTDLPTGQGELVLLVDDEVALRELIKNILEACGYRVMIANDGNDALIQYGRHKDQIALVLTDMMMPFMDGPALIRALRRVDPKAKIIAATGLATDSKMVEAKVLGVNGFIAKPYTAEKLLTMLHEVLSLETEELVPMSLPDAA
ncbi:MAG: response regulator [Verrucomicrobiales bacterium]|nr:response regulator [Verrucomicrobiales bacterium]